MNSKPYCLLTALIMDVVGVFHLLRIILSIPVVAGGWEMPLWLSWLGFPVCFVISGWGFLLAFRRE